MGDDGNRLLNIFGAALGAMILFALIVVVLSAMNATTQQPTEVPDTTWGADRINTTHVQLTLTGNESVNASKIVLAIDGTEFDPDWTGTLSVGDRKIIGVSVGSTIEIFWAPGTETRVPIGRVQV